MARMNRRKGCLCALIAAGACQAWLAAAQAQVTIEPVVTSIGALRDPVPNRPAPFVFRGESNVQFPVINNAHDVVFRARSASSFDTNVGQAWGIYAKRPGEPMIALVDTLVDNAGTPGFPVPGRPLTASFNGPSIKTPLLNNAGDVIFIADFVDPVGGSGKGIYATHVSGGPLVKVVDSFDTVPGIGVTFYSGGVITNEDLTAAVLNDAGQVAFWAQFTGATGAGLFGSTVSGGPIVALATPAITPTGVPFGTAQPFVLTNKVFALNNAGQLAFSGTIRLNSSSGPLRRGAFRVPVTGGTPPATVVFESQTAPEAGATTFEGTSDLDIDETGRVVFYSGLSDGRTGIYSVDFPGGPFTRVVDTRPGGLDVPGDVPAAEFDGLWHGPINESGRVGLYARIRNSGTASNAGIYLAQVGATALENVHDKAATAPGMIAPARLTDFETSSYGEPARLAAAINEASNLVFSATGVSDVGTQNRGIYFYDRCADEVIRIVDSTTTAALLGGTFSTLGSQNRKLGSYQSMHTVSSRYRPLTEDNRVAFLAQFNNSDFGIYVATITSAGGGGEITITCPDNVALECPADSSPAALGEATAVDGCSGDSVPVTYADTTEPGCGTSGTVTRVWTADDGAGHTATCTQVVEVDDTVAPVLNGVPADTFAECDAVPAAAIVTAADACDAAPTVALAETTTAGGCPGDYTLERSWTATDACGNSTSAAQLIDVSDTTIPQVTCPADQVTLACGADITPAATGDATATDNCGGASAAYADTSVDGCGETLAIERTWTATDDCGNASTCVQQVATVDATAPQIACPVDQLTLACGSDTGTVSTGSATATDDCGAATVAYSENSVAGCGSTLNIARTWTATDDCGNTSECAQIVATVDTTAPSISCPADQIGLACGADTSVTATGSATATDDCGEATVAYAEASTGACGGAETITRTWTATDACGNTSTCEQTVSTTDAVAPSITCPADQIGLACGADTSVAATGSATATDDCGDATVAYAEASTGPCGGAETITRTWTATDACGNTSTCEQTVSTTDALAPTITCPADQIGLACGADISVEATGSATATDDCGDATVTYTEASEAGCGGAQTITRTWTATDDCGNASSCVQTVSNVDSTPPAITCPADQSGLECGADTSPAVTGTATASDACGAATVVYSDATASACGGTGTIARTWTATDDCGNVATCTQDIATVDNTPPILSVNTTPIILTDVNCSGSEPVTLPAGTATDACGTVTVTHNGPATLPAGQTTTVTFTAVDACGNVATTTRDVTVKYGATIAIDAQRFLVGLGSHPSIQQEPLDDIEVCAYKRGSGSCALSQCGILYLLRFPCILSHCAPVACAMTDEEGYAELNVPPGKYVVISDDATQLILPTPLGGVVDDLNCGRTELVRLRQIEIATGRRLACLITRLTGSELLILQPEEVLWDETEQLYPFVFESVGDWDVTVAVTPPDGFIADYDELSEEVANDTKAVQFTITEVGSDLVPTETEFQVVHNGRTRVVRNSVGIALTAEYARSRGFNVRELQKKGLIKERSKWEQLQVDSIEALTPGR